MDTYHVVLYLHLLALFIGIGAGSVLLTCLFQLRAARTVEQAVPWAIVSGKVLTRAQQTGVETATEPAR